MTVAELIEALKAMPLDAPVVAIDTFGAPAEIVDAQPRDTLTYVDPKWHDQRGLCVFLS